MSASKAAPRTLVFNKTLTILQVTQRRVGKKTGGGEGVIKKFQ